MGIDFGFAKRFAGGKILEKAMQYIEKNPEENFLKALNLAEKAASKEKVLNKIEVLRRGFKNNSMVRSFVKQLDQIAPSYKSGLLPNFFINAGLLGIPYQQEMSKELGVDVPWAILLDPTSACNLECEGCWAGKYDKADTLKIETIDRIINEAKDLGIYFFVLSGGEPTVYPRLFEIFERHQDAGFMMYTNGTLIDDDFIDNMLEVGNVSPVFSLEGFKERTDARRGKGVFDKIVTNMEKMKEKGIIFGTSLTITRKNVDEIFRGDEFVDFLIEKGVTYSWSFHYIPIGRDPNLDLMLTPEQRKFLAHRIPEIRGQKPIFIADFWNDGNFTKGCIAGGRKYFHINAKGDVEPCAFVHFAVDNIKNKSLKEVLQNPLFKAYQKRQPFNDNHMAPCPIIDNPEKLREMVKEAEANPTHPQGENILKGEVARHLDKISKEWDEISRPLNESRKNS